MSFYVQTWLPLLTVALTAAICFSVASFMMGPMQKASSAIISTPHSGRNDRNGMVRVHLATLPKTIDEALGKAPNQPRPHGSAAPNSNAPASDVIAPPSKSRDNGAPFLPGQSRTVVQLVNMADK